MRYRYMLGLATAAAAAALLVMVAPTPAQQDQGFPTKNGAPANFKGRGGKGKAKGPSRPTPRTPDGHISFEPLPGEHGTWSGSAGTTLANRVGNGGISNNRINLPTNLNDDEVPFLPWSRALYNHRIETLTADDPHVRCKSEGGARLFHTPYGFEIVQVPEMQQIFIMGVGGPHTYHTIYMDGRDHPADLDPTYHGHSIGHWEGDTLVVDTVGFNTRFWLSRGGFPHTEQLHTIETFERPDYDTLIYKITIDDPGAYTEPWTGGWRIPFGTGNELYEYVCQENNRDSRHMYGGDEE